ncbi:hypothetical protein ACGGZK_18715 [Agromyces sp. MMS24-K17]|uniref:hypothetical protein n=1 Tax=Agromyces sp. MMS24-K17 TaxID=3372850 RepID=UPI0037542843
MDAQIDVDAGATGTPTIRQLLLRLLEAAAAAHGAFEADELGGVFDEAWPDWYAGHMTDALTAAGYRLSRELDQR